VQHTNTDTLFTDLGGAYYVDHLLDNFPNSSVRRITADHVMLYINSYDLRDQMSMTTEIVGGYTMSFFVGISYFTVLPTNAISTVSAQTKITVTSSNSLTFSFTSEQDYTFVDYVSMSLVQVSCIYVPEFIIRISKFVCSIDVSMSAAAVAAAVVCVCLAVGIAFCVFLAFAPLLRKNKFFAFSICCLAFLENVYSFELSGLLPTTFLVPVANITLLDVYITALS
jgi:hypothetical protein